MSDPILAVEDLEKVYAVPEGTLKAVDGVTVSVDRGEVVGLLGPNGAGKTTTIKCILGLVVPTAGSVRIDGVDPTARPGRVYRRVSAVLEGARNVYWRLTVRENLRFFAGCQGVHPNEATDRYDRLLATLDLEAKADEQVRHLSRGMQQKTSLACSLVRETPLVFLDEPTLGLDVEASLDMRQELRRLAEEENRTIVVSSHDMDVVEDVCDRVLIMNDGAVVANDRVADLVGVFESQSYEVSFVAGTAPTEMLAAFGGERVDGRERPTYEVVVAGSDEFYSFVEGCRDADAEVERIDAVEPDLEEVFLSVTGRAGDAETRPPSGTTRPPGGTTRPPSGATGPERPGGGQ